MTKRLKADFMLLFITIVWGASFPLMKIVIGYIPAFSYLSLRFLLAAFLLAWIYRKKLKEIKRSTLCRGSIIGAFMFGGMALQVCGLYTTSASNSGFITGLNVVMVPVASAILLKKRPDRASLVGVVLAFIGLFWLSGGVRLSFNQGDLLTLLCAICWTFQIIFIDRFNAEEEPVLLAILQMGFTGVMSTGVWLAFDFQPMDFNRDVIAILLFTGIMGTALAFTGQTVAQKHTSPTHTALILTLEPVFAALFALIIPNAEGKTENLSLTMALGCILMLGGMLVSELKLGNKQCKE